MAIENYSKNGNFINQDQPLVMKHPLYFVSNSLIIQRKYWNQQSYENYVKLQNDPDQLKQLNQSNHSYDHVSELETVKSNRYINDPKKQ